MKYCVVMSRTGCAFVEAENEADAMDLANNLSSDEISWSDDWEATDVSEDESILSCIEDDD